jgi:predicted small lipoprotein YifL
MRPGVAAAATALLLAGCGQKGPLYLPDHKPAVVPTPAPAAAAPAADPAAIPPAPKKKTDEDSSQAPAPK